MPYNTRRKSLSLSELGVHVPKRARAPSQVTANSPPREDAEPPNKKARCVPQFVAAPGSMSPPKTTNIRIKSEDIRPVARGVENTPPPSPGAQDYPKVSTEGIKDEVVVGAIVQLEKTGNRPHTSKELAAALAHTVPTIDTSTNPNALVQARLANYLKGPWPIVTPCPLGKQQENVHPRRVFYFLTAYPHQPIPDTSMQPPRRVISPALSVNSDEEMVEKYMRERTALSPSPEVDLSSPELEDDNEADHASMYSSHASLPRNDSSADLSHNHRAASPPLEREERDFKQTANQLQQQRRDSQQKSRQASEAAVKMEGTEPEEAKPSISAITVNDEVPADHTHEAVVSLFGTEDNLVTQPIPPYDLSSPVLKPQLPVMSIDAKINPPKLNDISTVTNTTTDLMAMSIDTEDPTADIWTWEEHKSPENVDLEELSSMFDAY